MQSFIPVRGRRSSCHGVACWVKTPQHRKFFEDENEQMGISRNVNGEGCAVDGVFCPKARRIGLPLHVSEMARAAPRVRVAEARDTIGMEIVDTIRMKVAASSPPVFSGSPPIRTSNPIIQEEMFVSAFEGLNMRPTPATVRIEGFNCNEDCRFYAVA